MPKVPPSLEIPLHIKTPLLESLAISKCAQRKIYLKMESSQRTGSFKIRGIGRLCQEMIVAGKRHLVSSSGGNAGYTVAWIGRRLGIKTTVFLPRTTHPVFVRQIRAEGAMVQQIGEVWDDAHAAAEQFIQTIDEAVLIPPFDNPIIWAGHSTLVDELITQMEKPAAILVSIGGGGLACGLLEGLYRHGWTDVVLLAAEAKGAAALAASLKNGKPTALSTVNTMISTLATKRITDALFAWTKKHPIVPLAVEDSVAVKACYRFANDHRVLVEPACGVALAAAYDRLPQLDDYDRILIIVCGGIGISFDLLNEYMA